ncbi:MULTISPECIES: fimbrial protein [Proteus]|uniref:Type 1 fimbrial protein n=1 Tax=Proteus penneri TaxID=102862 RepID=A0ABS0VZS0_9GAMM|nr:MULTISPECIES: fimbrial protein [Proteus]MBJ2116552.1 type 1 fimbrial protein [Proteus penneri]MCO8052168.1 type 1 fimbrial protein [Proteus penneri]MCX2589433.1 type 1 fimbrial protein [Proteus penneri]NBL76151.1 fimbrial protein [Proteus sp. G2672]NBL89279.1 fimbrial protein [Proteus sp. G2673]
MKKSLFSLLILSTLSLSNQAIAEDSYLIHANNEISIRGNVIKKAPTCTLDNIEPVVLNNIYADEIEHSETKEFKINFSSCDVPNGSKEISIKLQRQDDPILKNTHQGEDKTNVSIQLFDEDNRQILLNQDDNLTLKKDIIGGDAEFILKANYKAPDDGEIKAGLFTSSLTFDAYINDNIAEEIEEVIDNGDL